MAAEPETMAGRGFRHLSWTVEGHVAHVVMDRPPVNAVDRVMYAELEQLFSEPQVLGRDARAIVLSGAGRHFCAGNDLDDFTSLDYDNTPAITKLVRQAFFAISDCDLPVVAAVHGAALGSGLAIAASADVIVATEDARLGLPELSVGVMGGARHLARLVPQPVVRWMFLSAEPMPAVELARYGAILRIVPKEELVATAIELAGVIARHSPVALRYGKKALNVIEHMDLKPGYEYEQGMTREMTRFADAKEALQASLERRQPQYRGE